jgi:pimeloyl-ACP methyl ester carboxylesterase
MQTLQPVRLTASAGATANETPGSQSPAHRYPLADLRGASPPAPQWFRDAIAVRPERLMFPVSNAEIELLLWGRHGNPALLFLHGDGAHADWWSFIAPFFAKDWLCVAMSWSGMGASGRRAKYSLEGYAEEALAAVKFLSLDDTRVAPIVVAHSLGGYPAMLAGADPGVFRAIVLVDSGIVTPPATSNLVRSPPRPHPIFPTLEAALARFRFQPAEVVQNDYITDHIARRSFCQVPGGWTWRFDPELLCSLEIRDMDRFPAMARCPLAYMWGAKSPLLNGDIIEKMTNLFPQGTPFVSVPEAGHHVMIDQPLAFVATLRALLASKFVKDER